MVLALSTSLEKRISPLSKRRSWPFRAGLGQLSTGTSKVPEVDQKQSKVETDRLGPWKALGERAQVRERERRTVLVVEADGRRGEGFRVVRGQPRSRADPAGPACSASRTCCSTSGRAVGSGANGGGLPAWR